MQTQIITPYTKITYSFDLCPIMDTEVAQIEYIERPVKTKPKITSNHHLSYWSIDEVKYIKQVKNKY